MKIFIINGPECAGKDTFVKMIQDIGHYNAYAIYNASTVDCVKNIAYSFGWKGEKTDRDRKMLSDLKDLLTQWNDIPYKSIRNTIEKIKNKYEAIFIHCREPEEIERFVQDYHALTIFVDRGIVGNYGNHADDNCRNYDYDIIIDNSRGLKELQEEAQIFFDTFIKKEGEA